MKLRWQRRAITIANVLLLIAGMALGAYLILGPPVSRDQHVPSMTLRIDLNESLPVGGLNEWYVRIESTTLTTSVIVDVTLRVETIGTSRCDVIHMRVDRGAGGFVEIAGTPSGLDNCDFGFVGVPQEVTPENSTSIVWRFSHSYEPGVSSNVRFTVQPIESTLS